MTFNSETFDWGRFKAVIRRDLRMEARTIWMCVAVVAGLFAFFAWVMTDNPKHSVYYSTPTTGLMIIYSVIGFIAVALGASLFGRGNSTPGRRINELMVPASECEKFVSRFVLSVIAVPVVVSVCLIIVELGRVGIISLLWGPKYTGGFIWPWSVLTNIGSNRGLVSGICMLISCQAVFALGSAIWHKYSVLKTMLAMWVIQSVFSVGMVIAVTLGSLIHIGRLDWSSLDSSYFFVDNILFKLPWLFNFCFLLWTVFCYAMCYMRLTEKEVINRH